MNSSSTKNKIKNFFDTFWRYRFLLKEIVRKNVKLQYRNSVLGMFWTFLQPLLTTLVLVLVFGGIFGRNDPSVGCYTVYLLCGRLLYEFYTQSTKRAMRSIRNSASVIKKVYVPKYIYPLSNVLSNVVTFLMSLLVLVVMVIYFKVFTDEVINITPYALLSVVPILLLIILCTGIGMILATLNVFFKDIEYIYDVFCMLLFYMTPIFYTVKSLGANRIVQLGLKANPLYSIISMFRDCVLYGTMWNWNHFWYALAFSVITVVIGSLAFWKKQDKFILHI